MFSLLYLEKFNVSICLNKNENIIFYLTNTVLLCLLHYLSLNLTKCSIVKLMKFKLKQVLFLHYIYLITYKNLKDRNKLMMNFY